MKKAQRVLEKLKEEPDHTLWGARFDEIMMDLSRNAAQRIDGYIHAVLHPSVESELTLTEEQLARAQRILSEDR